jgi:hypothetical protein
MCYFFSAQSQMLYTRQSSGNSLFGTIIGESGTDNFLIVNEDLGLKPAFDLTKCQILKISPAGVLLDSLNFGPGFYFFGPPIAINNFYYGYGVQIKTYGPGSESYFSIIFKIDQNLNLVQQAIIDTSYNDIIRTQSIILKNNRLYLGNWHQTSNQAHFYKTDLNLVKKDSMVSQGFLHDLSNYGNKLLASGSGFAQGSIFGNNQVMEMDTSFNVLSRFNLDSLTHVNPGCSSNVGIRYTISNLYEISPTKYAVIGYYPVVNSATCNTNIQNITSVIKNNNQVLKTNIVGDTYKDNVIGGGHYSGSKKYKYIYTTAMTEYDTQNPFPPQTNTTQILVHKIDTLGNLIWAKYYSDPNMYYNPYGVYATPDSGVIVCGMRYNLLNPAVPNACEGFVMKLDKAGNQQFVGIYENGMINTNYHRCFPNPADNLIKFDFPFQQNIKIKIFDVHGKVVKVISDYQNLNAVELSELSPGFYFYEATTKTNHYSGKVVKR